VKVVAGLLGLLMSAVKLTGDIARWQAIRICSNESLGQGSTMKWWEVKAGRVHLHIGSKTAEQLYSVIFTRSVLDSPALRSILITKRLLRNSKHRHLDGPGRNDAAQALLCVYVDSRAVGEAEVAILQ